MKLLETLNRVILNAMQKEPAAWLYEIQAIMKEKNGEVCPDNVYHMKVVFGLPDTRTLIYDVNKEGTMFSQTVESQWLEDRPLPNQITIDLEEAYRQMMIANLAFDYVCPSLVLRFPLHPDVYEPAYIFTVSAKGTIKFVAVTLYSAKVRFVE